MLPSLLVYATGAAMAAFGLRFGRHGHTITASNGLGSVVAGNVNGAVTMTSIVSVPAPETDRQSGGRVGLDFTMVGLLVASVQLVFDISGLSK